MNLPQIRNVEQLRDFMEKVSGKTIKDENLIWFACIGYAESLSDCTLKDLASLFSDGVEAVKTLEDVQKYIDTFFEDEDEEYSKQQNLYLIAGVYRFYGIGTELLDL